MFLLGLVAAPEQVTSQRLSALIQQIMGDATFLSNAGRLQQVIRDTGGLAAAADLLEQALGNHHADRSKHMSTNITKKLEGKVALVTGGHHDEARTENRRPHGIGTGNTAIRDFTHIYINGEWVKPLGGKVIDIINPATERPAGQIALGTAADVDRAVAAARRAFITFSRSSRQERLDLLSRILEVYLKRQDDLADALTEELGAPKKFAKERQVGVGLLHLQTAIAVLKDYQFEYPKSNRTIIRREPIGVVGMITPWNWPINQLVVKAFPAFARSRFSSSALGYLRFLGW